MQGIDISSPSITKIEASVFEGYALLTKEKISSCVTEICESAFKGCSYLNQITIPKSVTWIVGYKSLRQIEIRPLIPSIPNSLFSLCHLKEVTIPSSVTKICESSFNSCSSLESVLIPSSVTEIGTCCFYECSSLVKHFFFKNQNRIKSIFSL